MSDNLEQAEEMARSRVELLGGRPIVLKYEFDERLLLNDKLKVKCFEGYTADWAKFILANRNVQEVFTHDYDVVVGPIANDRVGRQLWRFNNGDIDMQQLINNLQYMKGCTMQYYFGTERSIKYLKRI